MLQFSGHGKDLNVDENSGKEGGLRPVTKTFYDHTQSINDLAFHPFLNILASASRDNSIKLFDYGGSQKKSHQVLQDTHNVRSIVFHPSGECPSTRLPPVLTLIAHVCLFIDILAGTDHTVLRLYDVNTGRAYVNPQSQTNHLGPVNQVAYSSDGKLYASVSKDGSLKIWDGSNSRCINTIPNAHSGLEVSSVQFSKNRKYILTGGKDCRARLWDIMMARPIVDIHYGATTNSQQRFRLQTRFSYNEDFIFVSDEPTNSVLVFDTRTKEMSQRLVGHNNTVRWIAPSPADPYVLTCSDDYRGRFWLDDIADAALKAKESAMQL